MQDAYWLSTELPIYSSTHLAVAARWPIIIAVPVDVNPPPPLPQQNRLRFQVASRVDYVTLSLSRPYRLFVS